MNKPSPAKETTQGDSAVYKKAVIMLAIIIGTSGCTGKTSEELYLEGVKLLREGKPGGAIVLLKSALEKKQNYLDARYQLANAYIAEKKYDLAEKELQKVKLLNPKQAGINLDLAKLFTNLGKPDLAILHAKEHLLDNADNTEALGIIGIAYRTKKIPQEAETYFRAALQKEPGNIKVRLELAALQAEQEKTEEARALLEEILRENPANSRALYLLADTEIVRGRKAQALAIYKKLTEISANDPVAPYKAGLLHYEMGNTSIAESIAGDLIKKYPSRAEGYCLKGIVSNRNKKFPEAITSLQHANKLQPTVAGHLFLGLSHYGNGELESALNQFRLILDRVPQHNQARLLTGIILLQQKRVDDAITELSKVSQADTGNAQAHNMLGSAYMAKGLYEEGMKELDTAVKLEPRLVDAYLKKGMLHLSRGKTAEVEVDLMTAIRIAPELINTRLILASFYESRNNRAKALATLKDGLSNTKSDVVLYCAMAKVMFADNKTDKAVSYLNKAKEIDRSSVAPEFMFAAHYTNINEVDKALKEYSELLQKDPHNVKAMLRVATLLESAKRDSEALTWYLKAKESQEPEAYLALASRYNRSGNHAQALKTCDELILRNPTYAPAYFTQGLFLDVQGRKKDAITKYLAAIAQSGSYAAPLNNLAYLYLDGFGNNKEALQLAERAVALEPGNPRIMDTVGYALLKNNRHQEAIKILEKALKQLPEDPEVNYHLALALRATGEKKQAVERLQIALRTEGFAGVQQVKNLLAELN
jgi:putative PEP-CTERM system TPR-repeat lipoprotein